MSVVGKFIRRRVRKLAVTIGMAALINWIYESKNVPKKREARG